MKERDEINGKEAGVDRLCWGPSSYLYQTNILNLSPIESHSIFPPGFECLKAAHLLSLAGEGGIPKSRIEEKAKKACFLLLSPTVPHATTSPTIPPFTICACVLTGSSLDPHIDPERHCQLTCQTPAKKLRRTTEEGSFA